jgi:hypothetical protein
MRCRIRHGVECPNCLTRYLVAFSPYSNGSYLVPTVSGSLGECILYCSCSRPHVRSRWQWNDVKAYVVSKRADDRGCQQEWLPGGTVRRCGAGDFEVPAVGRLAAQGYGERHLAAAADDQEGQVVARVIVGELMVPFGGVDAEVT